MLKEKAFTLVELLAVIIILAIISVIAVPQVFKIIEKSRQDAFLVSLGKAIKLAEQNVVEGTYNKDTKNYLSALSLNNSPFKNEDQGYWEYNVENKTIIIPIASSSDNKYQVNDVANKKLEGYTIIEEASVIKTKDLLSTRIKSTFDSCSMPPASGNYNPTACIVTVDEYDDSNVKGYIRGPQTGVNNYVEFASTVWRIVKINSNGTMLMVMDDVIGTSNNPTKRAYNTTYNNFDNSTIKTYLNSDYYNPISTTYKKMLTDNIWDTRCEHSGIYEPCVTNSLTTTIAKVGLLTYYDYVVGTRAKRATSYNTYLNRSSFDTKSIIYWLGTGNDVFPGSNNNYCVIKTGNTASASVSNTNSVRPAVVLKASIFLDCDPEAGECNGSLEKPYKIK